MLIRSLFDSGLVSRILKPQHNPSDPESRFLKPHHNPFVLPISSYSKMLIRSLCGSGARFQISEALSQSFCFAVKFLSKDVDGEPLWLRSQIPGFRASSKITLLSLCGSRASFQICEASPQSYQLAVELLCKDYDSEFLCGAVARLQALHIWSQIYCFPEPPRLRGQLPGFAHLIQILLLCL